MGEPDFEICLERRNGQPQTKVSREKQLSPTLAFVSFCRLLSEVLSQFLHNPKSTRIVNSKPATRIDQASLSRSDRPESETFSLTTNQVPRANSRTFQGFFDTVQRLCGECQPANAVKIVPTITSPQLTIQKWYPFNPRNLSFMDL